MPRKSEVDKIIDRNITKFDKYHSYEAWKKVHFKGANEKKYRDAWNKRFGLDEVQNGEEIN